MGMLARAATLTPWARLVGDQHPPPYQVLNVHVPEPLMGPYQRKWSAEDSVEKENAITNVWKQMASQEETIVQTSAELQKHIADVASLAALSLQQRLRIRKSQ